MQCGIDLAYLVRHQLSSLKHLIQLTSRGGFSLSDFPHLVKCIRNGFIKNGYKTPDRHVDVRPIMIAHDLDKCATTLKAMPKITEVHLNPNNFEK